MGDWLRERLRDRLWRVWVRASIGERERLRRVRAVGTITTGERDLVLPRSGSVRIIVVGCRRVGERLLLLLLRDREGTNT